MLDAAQVIGEALSESSECAQDARAMATSYINAVNDIVKAVAATNGGNLAAYTAAGTSLLTAYNKPPVTGHRFTKVYGYIATDSESGLTYRPSAAVDASDIMLFANNSTWKETPLSFWLQTAGVWDNAAHGSLSFTGLTVLWPLSNGASSDAVVRDLTVFAGGKTGGALSRWLATTNPLDSSMGRWNYIVGEGFSVSTYGAGDYGLGSREVPYLIVCASDNKSAAGVKADVVKSMVSNANGNGLTPYSLLPYGGGSSSSTYWPSTTIGGQTFLSTLGAAHGEESQSPFFKNSDPLLAADVVRENPRGLLGSWSEGNMESVLEAIWLADVYSRSHAGYTSPVTNMDGFSVSIAGVQCDSTEAAVRQFFKAFYRCELNDTYSAIVTDGGL
jgi:hypothetical protein